MSRKKTKSFLPVPRRCFLDISKPPTDDKPRDSLVQQGECRTDVTGIITMDIGSEIYVVGNMYRKPRREMKLRKHQYGEYQERSFIYSKGFYEIRCIDRVVKFLMDKDGITVDTYGWE